MGHFVTGVTVVAAKAPGSDPVGLTANALASVSLEPTLVLVCVDLRADSHDGILAAGAFSVNVLASDHERLARRFASWETKDKFRGIAWREEVTGAPVLDGALAWLDCRVRDTHPGGDHTIIVGEVVAADARDGTPLVYYRGGYGRFTP